MPATAALGTCPQCGERAVIVNHSTLRGIEVGYLGRHHRPGTRAGSKCRGSFGRWLEKRHPAPLN